MEDLRLPEKLRDELKKPLGVFLETSEYLQLLKESEDKTIITVGDTVTSSALSIGIRPKLVIIDFLTERKGVSKELRKELEKVPFTLKAKNPAGLISAEAWESIKKAILSKEKEVLLIDGEEDLLAIPAVLEADKGTLVFYGLPKKGVILIVVEPNIKSTFTKLLEKFEKLK